MQQAPRGYVVLTPTRAGAVRLQKSHENLLSPRAREWGFCQKTMDTGLQKANVSLGLLGCSQGTHGGGPGVTACIMFTIIKAASMYSALLIMVSLSSIVCTLTNLILPTTQLGSNHHNLHCTKEELQLREVKSLA